MIGKFLALSAGLVLGVVAGHTVADRDRPAPEPTTVATARPSSPPAPASFGRFRCMLGEVAMTIDDRPDEMAIETDQARMSLPRNHELSDDQMHVAAVHSSGRSVSVTIDRNAHATLTMRNADNDTPYEFSEGDCTAL